MYGNLPLSASKKGPALRPIFPFFFINVLAVLVLCYANPSAAAAILITSANTGLPITQFLTMFLTAIIHSFSMILYTILYTLARVMNSAFHGYSIYIILYPCQERKMEGFEP